MPFAKYEMIKPNAAIKLPAMVTFLQPYLLVKMETIGPNQQDRRVINLVLFK